MSAQFRSSLLFWIPHHCKRFQVSGLGEVPVSVVSLRNYILRVEFLFLLLQYLRRIFHFRQMDFEFALWQMIYLMIKPQQVYRNFAYRKVSP